jgi:hypothetical protein
MVGSFTHEVTKYDNIKSVATVSISSSTDTSIPLKTFTPISIHYTQPDITDKKNTNSRTRPPLYQTHLSSTTLHPTHNYQIHVQKHIGTYKKSHAFTRQNKPTQHQCCTWLRYHISTSHCVADVPLEVNHNTTLLWPLSWIHYLAHPMLFTPEYNTHWTWRSLNRIVVRNIKTPLRVLNILLSARHRTKKKGKKITTTAGKKIQNDILEYNGLWSHQLDQFLFQLLTKIRHYIFDHHRKLSGFAGILLVIRDYTRPIATHSSLMWPCSLSSIKSTILGTLSRSKIRIKHNRSNKILNLSKVRI